jgi:hypothetical protein
MTPAGCPNIDAGTIRHSARCPKPSPILRRLWDGLAELFCRSCGHAAPSNLNTNPKGKQDEHQDC